MFEIQCPYCDEKRPEIEFAYAGEAHIVRAVKADDLSDQAWAEFLFYRDNKRGDHCERWWHQHGCNMFFNAVRNTVTDKFVMTYKIGQKRPSAESIKAGQHGRK
jgi:sarcosine oxidase subunit delta